ncbi:2-oxo-tetronate isomerase [Pelagovum pacificum]|uniref:Hydroxypyruvate isomerase n=1 Tax=Pelagovum pacificum TaxID=2588711 RepID=A0A5C5GAG1_9RHOB|nr:2-oxo-tetronate isomerase [Pelagovum pacificum]QQA41751.1 hydroxypyruvate isomerase [Pelagovum pacificum]TNY31025.1 hydroxypyruvate isomerase [Pelagovum pacificum]
MPKFSANLSMLYTEHGFLDRFAAAAADGFKGVEYLGPYDEEPDTVAKALADNGLTQVLFNLPSGDWAGGERGLGGLPGREAEFAEGVDTAIRYAKALGCEQVNCLAGIAPAGNEAAHEAVLVENLKMAADRLGTEGIRLLLEPINTRDIPGFLVNGTDQFLEIADRVGSSNLWLQYDFYHMQIMQGDLIPTYQALQDRIAHVQIADNPGRHEPGTGEINHPYLFESLDRLGYAGWVGAEYKPAAGTSEGLGWMKGA